MKFEDYDIIFFARPRWDAIYSSGTFYTAKILSKTNRVFYIDHPYTYREYINIIRPQEKKFRKNALIHGKDIYTKVEGLPDNFTAVTPQLTFPINFLPPGFLYNYFYKLNDKIVYRVIKRIISDFNVKNYIYINSFDPYYGLTFPSDFKPDIFIYKTSDDISQEVYTARHGTRLENEMIKRADIVLATSMELKKLKSELSDYVEYLPNSADVDLFKKAHHEDLTKPVELRDIKTKVIGYMGALSTRLDYQLFRKVAEFHKDKTLVLVGSKDNEDYQYVGLEEMKNVVFTGPKKIEELPAYLKYFDCTIIPFEISRLTKSIYPLKLNEYLAGGKPVVMTNFTDLDEFKDVTYIAKDHDEFLKLIDIAIEDDSKEKCEERISVASGNSWDIRVERLKNIVNEYNHERKIHSVGKEQISSQDLSGYDIIILALPRWDAEFSSCIYSTAKELAKTNRVFYIDHPFTFNDYRLEKNSSNIIKRKSALLHGKNIYKKVDTAPENFTAVTPRLTLPINFLSDGFLYKILSRINDKIVYKTFKKIIKDNDVKKFIYINSNDPFYSFSFLNKLDYDVFVYQSFDDISEEDYTSRHGVRMENQMVKRADIVITTSEELKRLRSDYSDNVHCIPNAADISLFETAWKLDLPKPEELKNIHTKIIGYTGAITTRLDYPLLKKIAEYHSDKTLILIGPKDTAKTQNAGLEEIPNVVFTGSKSIEELPAYLKYFNCCIIPFECNKLTRSIYPLKINEYLAACKPVVMTNFSKLDEFNEVAYIAKNHDEFLKYIDIAIDTDSKEKQEARYNVASKNSWAARTEQLRGLIKDFLNQKNNYVNS